MADPQTAFLQALFANNGVGGDPMLNSFQKTVAQNDPWRMVAAPVLSAQFNRSTWSPTESLGVSAGQAFLGSLLNSLGAASEARQLNSAAAVLPELFSNPAAVATPEGVDAEAFNGLRLAAARENIIRGIKSQEADKEFQREMLAAVGKKNIDVAAAGPIAQSQEAGKLAALSGLDPSSPDLPSNKKAQQSLENIAALRKEFNSLEDVKDFGNVLQSANAISKALKDNSKISDQELTRYSILLIEPGMAVREGEQGAVLKSQSIPDAWRGEMASALEGNTSLSDKVREDLKRLAIRAYDAKKYNYEKAFDYYQTQAVKKYGMPADESISFYGKALPSESIFSAPADPMQEEMRSQAKKLAAEGYSKREIADALREVYGNLVSK